jgi:hypothetical protein
MSKESKRQVKVDMTDVQSYGRATEGQHVFLIKELTMDKTSDGDKMVKGMFEVTKGDCKGSRVIENFPLTDSALWKIQGLLKAIGMKYEGKIIIDLDKMEGKSCIGEVEHNEGSNGKLYANIVQFFNLKDAGKKTKDEDDDDDDDDDEEEETKKKPSKKSAAKTSKKSKKDDDDDEDDDDEDDDDDDDDDDDEDEKPAKKKGGKKKPEAKKNKKADKKKSKKSKDDDDDDDDEDWEDEDE